MTVKEKREALSHFCDKFDFCDDCPLNESLAEHNGCYSSNVAEDVVEHNYKIVFGGVAEEAEPVGTDRPVIVESPALAKLSKHADICNELNALYARKNADYGDSFHKTYIEEGVAMARIRLSDKLERFKRLTKSNEQHVQDESVRDTLIDLANYAIMTILEIDGGRTDA